MASTWRVISQRQYEDLTPTGAFESVVEVTYQLTASGVVGSVKVSMRDYSEDTVRVAINTAASTMANVQNLEG